MLALLEADGWHLDRQRGNHRQYKHPTKKGTITVSGNKGADMKKGTENAILKQAGLK